jgi:hypothetical protein
MMRFGILASSVAAAVGTVSFGALGTLSNSISTTTPAYPSGITSSSALFCFQVYANSVGVAPAAPSGWTAVGSYSGGGSTYEILNDVGPRGILVFRKDTVTGNESGTITCNASKNGSYSSVIARFEVTAGFSIGHQWSAGSDDTRDTSWSVTGSPAIDFQTGQLLCVFTAQNTDTATQSSQSISAAGITFDTRTNRQSFAVVSGRDHRSVIDTIPVTAGSGSVAPTWSHTNSEAASGATGFLLLSAVP